MVELTPEIKKIIEENALAFATVDKTGNPHCIAVGYPKVVDKNKIIITDVAMKKTLENIQGNSNVALTVWSRNWEEKCIGYELKGKAEYFISGKWKKFVEQMPENKGLPAKGAILVTINKIKKLV